MPVPARLPRLALCLGLPSYASVAISGLLVPSCLDVPSYNMLVYQYCWLPVVQTRLDLPSHA
eukprot:1457410-Karenia_brevis.AAC.2